MLVFGPDVNKTKFSDHITALDWVPALLRTVALTVSYTMCSRDYQCVVIYVHFNSQFPRQHGKAIQTIQDHAASKDITDMSVVTIGNLKHDEKLQSNRQHVELCLQCFNAVIWAVDSKGIWPVNSE